MRRGHGGTALVANERQVLRVIDELTKAGRPAYGYVMHGQIPADHGTVYRCLQRLTARGLLERSPGARSFGPPRFVYRLTPAGRDVISGGAA